MTATLIPSLIPYSIPYDLNLYALIPYALIPCASPGGASLGED